MTRDEVAKYVALCIGMWPQWKPQPTTPDAWELVLADVPYRSAVEAVKALSTEPYPPPPGKVREACLAATGTAGDVLAICDGWYRATDDVTRHPTRSEREREPLAALTWDLAGGYEALHDRNWAHHRLRASYQLALESKNADEARVAITASEADTFIRSLNG